MDIPVKQLFVRGICTDFEPAYEWNNDRTAPKIQRRDSSGRPLFKYHVSIYPTGGGRPVEGAITAAPGKVPPTFGTDIALDGIMLTLKQSVDEKRIRQVYILQTEALTSVG